MSTCYYAHSAGEKLFPIPLCQDGFYCPNTLLNNQATYPVLCPPSTACARQRALGYPCTDGFLGAQGIYEPIVCPRGYYCSTPLNIQMWYPVTNLSPESHYCPTGSIKPLQCDYFSYCPPGSPAQFVYGGVILCAILDLLLIALYYLYKRSENRKHIKKTLSKNVLSLTDVNQNYEKSFEGLLQGSTMRWDFRMDDLGLKLKSGKEILKGVSGYIRAAKLTAIMGPSETTFMSVLCGKVQRTSGKLFISGKQIELYKFKKLIGFVPQEDVMHRGLTVRENLLYSARIRLPFSWTTQQIENHVDGLIEILNLTSVANSIVGDESNRGISGGQRKRVNVGIELVSIPLCLFLDEPTSGLDSVGALEVVDILSRITKMGITVVAVIHQPRTAFPEGVNEADILLDILNNRGVNTIKDYTPDELADYWHQYAKAGNKHIDQRIQVEISNITPETSFRPTSVSVKEIRPSLVNDQLHYESFHKIAGEIIKVKGASVLKQIYDCHNLSLIQMYRSLSSIYLPVLVSIICGAIVGLSLDPNYDSFIGLYQFLFLFLPSSPVLWKIPQFGLSLGFSSALAASAAGVNVFGLEKHVYWRNASSGHSKLAYYFVIEV
ncbi:hypothetical protein HDV06_004532 [Boothiomyces sp. JEL0866]|nr:hypothetical protein HDV06_004532 [Boothiomyces sp. JEL0866]